MDEKELIKQLKQLRYIQPNQDWVVLTKDELFGPEAEQAKGVASKAGEGKTSRHWLFSPLKRPALVLRPVLVMSLVLAAVFVYLYLDLNSESSRLAQLPIVSGIFEKKEAETEMLVVSLGEIQANLEKINHSLANLRNSKDTNEALAMTEVVKTTAIQGGEIVKQLKDKSPSKQVLSTLTEVEGSLRQMGETSYSMQKEMLVSYIEYLKGRSLTEGDAERLEKAEEYYKQGKEADAMMLLMKIGKDDGVKKEI